MRLIVWYLLMVKCAILGVKAAKILVVAAMPMHSHFTVAFTLAKELAERDHQVTCINPFPQKVPIKNYRDVSVERNIQVMEEEKKKLFSQENKSIFENMTSFFRLILSLTESTLANENVLKLLSSGESFDVIIVEYFLNDVLVGLGHHFKAPVIILSSVGASGLNNHLFANPSPASYVPGMGGTLTAPMNFWQRLENFLMIGVFNALIQFYHLPQQRQSFNRYLSKDHPLDETLYNASLMLVNSHVSISDAVPHVPAVVEIGGFHINTQKLPPDLQELLDDAKDGVVVFSMGSGLQSEDLRPEVRAGILRAFAKIKQKVLWKFESDLQGVPDNVKILPWLPQQDVLCHPNVKAFISHGGLLGNIEAVYCGVPIVGIPVFGDQKFNVASAVKNGYAVHVALGDLSEEVLTTALQEVLNNSKYRTQVQQRSKLMRDQPWKPIDKAVFWVEHVIRHRGAPHLRSAGLDLAWYQREMVDIFAFLISVLILLVTVVYLLSKKIRLLFCKPNKNVNRRKKKD